MRSFQKVEFDMPTFSKSHSHKQNASERKNDLSGGKNFFISLYQLSRSGT